MTRIRWCNLDHFGRYVLYCVKYMTRNKYQCRRMFYTFWWICRFNITLKYLIFSLVLKTGKLFKIHRKRKTVNTNTVTCWCNSDHGPFSINEASFHLHYQQCIYEKGHGSLCRIQLINSLHPNTRYRMFLAKL